MSEFFKTTDLLQERLLKSSEKGSLLAAYRFSARGKTPWDNHIYEKLRATLDEINGFQQELFVWEKKGTFISAP